MNRDEIRQVIGDVLSEVAPGADLDDLSPGEGMRQALDLDSFDFLKLLVGLAERLGVEVPEGDYGRVLTLEGMVEYFAFHGGALTR